MPAPTPSPSFIKYISNLINELMKTDFESTNQLKSSAQSINQEHFKQYSKNF